MKVASYEEAAAHVFNGEGVKGVTGRVAIGRNDGAANFCMRVFTLEPGGYTPKHSHSWEHEVFVHTGRGTIFRNGDLVDVRSGTVVFIPGGDEHQFKNTGEDPLIFVCLIPSGIPEM